MNVLSFVLLRGGHGPGKRDEPDSKCWPVIGQNFFQGSLIGGGWLDPTCEPCVIWKPWSLVSDTETTAGDTSLLALLLTVSHKLTLHFHFEHGHTMCEGWRRHSSLIFLILLFTKPNIEVSGWLYQTKTHFTHIVYQPFSRVSPPSFTLYRTYRKD